MIQVQGLQTLSLFSLCFPLYYLAAIHSGTFHICQGLPIAPRYGNKVRTIPKDKFGTPNLALYALAPNHVFGQ